MQLVHSLYLKLTQLLTVSVKLLYGILRTVCFCCHDNMYPYQPFNVLLIWPKNIKKRTLKKIDDYAWPSNIGFYRELILLTVKRQLVGMHARHYLYIQWERGSYLDYRRHPPIQVYNYRWMTRKCCYIVLHSHKHWSGTRQHLRIAWTINWFLMLVI